MQHRGNCGNTGKFLNVLYVYVWGILPLGQLHVRGRPHVHVIYHPGPDGPNELGGSYLVGRGRDFLQHFGFVSEPSYSREVCKPKTIYYHLNKKKFQPF